MSFPWLSRFVYGPAGSDTDWTTTLPVRPWNYPTASVGGSRTSASGTPAAYVVRQDYLLTFALRLYETELPALQQMVAWLQAGAESFRWYPDASEPLIYFTAYLEEPRAGERWQETRTEFGRVVEVMVTLRRVDGFAWGLDFFDCGV